MSALSLRCIGGPLDGRLVPLAPLASIYEHSAINGSRVGGLGRRVTTSHVTRYSRATVLLKNTGGTARYGEDVLVAPGIPLSEVERRVIALGTLPMYVAPARKFAEIEVSDSSMIDKIGYDPTASVLLVVIKNSDGTQTSYEYAEVPAKVFTEFLVDDSKGRFFNNRIKGLYVSKKLG